MRGCYARDGVRGYAGDGCVVVMLGTGFCCYARDGCVVLYKGRVCVVMQGTGVCCYVRGGNGRTVIQKSRSSCALYVLYLG